MVEFENEADRRFYLKEDPEHLSFVKGLGPLVEKVGIVDFEEGVF